MTSLVPFATSLKPGDNHLPIITLPPKVQAGGSNVAVPEMRPVSRRILAHSITRFLAISAAAGAIAGTALVASRSRWFEPHELQVRTVGTPTLKLTDKGLVDVAAFDFVSVVC